MSGAFQNCCCDPVAVDDTVTAFVKYRHHGFTPISVALDEGVEEFDPPLDYIGLTLGGYLVTGIDVFEPGVISQSGNSTRYLRGELVIEQSTVDGYLRTDTSWVEQDKYTGLFLQEGTSTSEGVESSYARTMVAPGDTPIPTTYVSEAGSPDSGYEPALDHPTYMTNFTFHKRTLTVTEDGYVFEILGVSQDLGGGLIRDFIYRETFVYSLPHTAANCQTLALELLDLFTLPNQFNGAAFTFASGEIWEHNGWTYTGDDTTGFELVIPDPTETTWPSGSYRPWEVVEDGLPQELSNGVCPFGGLHGQVPFNTYITGLAFSGVISDKANYNWAIHSKVYYFTHSDLCFNILGMTSYAGVDFLSYLAATDNGYAHYTAGGPRLVEAGFNQMWVAYSDFLNPSVSDAIPDGLGETVPTDCLTP